MWAYLIIYLPKCHVISNIMRLSACFFKVQGLIEYLYMDKHCLMLH